MKDAIAIGAVLGLVIGYTLARVVAALRLRRYKKRLTSQFEGSIASASNTVAGAEYTDALGRRWVRDPKSASGWLLLK